MDSAQRVTVLDDTSLTMLQKQVSKLHAIKDDLNLKNEEIKQQLERVHQDLRTKQLLLNQQANTHNPIVALPPEILSLIILHVVDFFLGKPSFNPYPTLVKLSSVCRRWRSVVLENPELWRNVVLDSSNRYDLGLILARSADLRLNIKISGNWSRNIDALVLLCQVPHRWRRLQMDVRGIPAGALLSSAQKLANSLACIRLVNPWKDGVSFRPAFAVRQDDLRTVTLVHVPMFKALIAPRLEHFAFVGSDKVAAFKVSSDRLFRILSASSTNLRTLRLGVLPITFEEEDQIKTILLPNLNHLTLYFESSSVDSEHIVKLLDTISAPTLQVIEFVTEETILIGRDKADFWESVLCKKERYALVTTLMVYNVLHHVDHVESFVKAFSKTKTLVIDPRGLACVSAAILERASELEQRQGQIEGQGKVASRGLGWESLQCIRLYVCRESEATDARMEDLLDWLQCRQSQGLPRMEVEVVMDCAEEWEWRESLRECSQLRVVGRPEEEFAGSSRYWLPLSQ